MQSTLTDKKPMLIKYESMQAFVASALIELF
jgi:hypothetical protein